VDNFLIGLIEQGKIRNLDQLKSAYRTATVRTHPDKVGSDEYLGTFLRLNDDYLAARAYLSRMEASAAAPANRISEKPRLSFFRQIDLIESLEMPYAYHVDDNKDQIDATKALARDAIGQWKPEWLELYIKADADLVAIKRSKPSGPYLKNALGLNLRPLIHNLIGYHLTGRKLYGKQAHQNLPGIMHRLEQDGYLNLKMFLSLLIEDMEEGSAVLE